MIKNKLFCPLQQTLTNSNNSMYDVIFEARLEELALLTPADKKFMKKNPASVIQEDLEKYIKDNSVKSDALISMLEEYIEHQNFIFGYFEEKYYKQSLADGISLIANSKNLL